MSLLHDNIRVWYDGLTTSTNPSKKEIQKRLRLIKLNGYKIDESKIKSWGPNLQKLWGKVSGKYITVNNKPYTASSGDNNVLILYDNSNGMDYNVYPGKLSPGETYADNLHLLMQMKQYETPFTDIPLINNVGNRYRVEDRDGYQYVVVDTKEGPQSVKIARASRDEADDLVFPYKKVNPFYNDYAIADYYDLNEYSTTPTTTSSTESTRSTNKEQPGQKTGSQSTQNHGGGSKKGTLSLMLLILRVKTNFNFLHITGSCTIQ